MEWFSPRQFTPARYASDEPLLTSSARWFSRARGSGSIDLVGEAVVVVGVGDRGNEPSQRRVEGLAVAAREHRQALRVVGGHCDALADRVKVAERYFAATLNERNDVPQADNRGAAALVLPTIRSAFDAVSSPTFTGTNISTRNSLDGNAISVGCSRTRR